MKHLLIPLLILTGYTTFAQHKKKYDEADMSYIQRQEETLASCHCSIIPTGTVILPGTAESRIKEFNTKVVNSHLEGLAKEAAYSAQGALAMLTMLAALDYKYDGFRAYFAVYPNQNSVDSGANLVPDHQHNKLAVIYVPTFINKEDQESDVHSDDTSKCMIIKDKSIEYIGVRYASMWINKAEKTVLKIMEDTQRKVDPKFNETRSLWYDLAFVVPDPIFHNGLIDILKCRMRCGNCQSVHARYAGFTRGTNKHQLSLVFMLGSDPVESFVSLWSGDVMPYARYDLKALDGSGGSDTGKPCPPPNPCNTNAGALLPNP